SSSASLHPKFDSLHFYLCPPLRRFSGIEPHFDLLQYLFHLRPQPKDTKIDVVGGAGLQLRQGVKSKYIPYQLSDKVIDRKELWFYVQNQSPSLPRRSAGPPVKK